MILGIFGAGGNGRTIVDAINIRWGEESPWEKVLFIDDVVKEKEVYQCQVYTYESMKSTYSPDEIELLISFGEPSERKKAFDMIKRDGYSLAKFIAIKTYMPQNCSIGEGAIIIGAFINSDVKIGDNTFVTVDAIIGHDSVIGSDCIIGPRAFVAGHCNIGNQVYIGPYAVLRDKIEIEDTAVVTMGAVVFKNVARDYMAIGNPARSMKKGDDFKVFK